MNDLLVPPMCNTIMPWIPKWSGPLWKKKHTSYVHATFW